MRIGFVTTEYVTEKTFAGGIASYTQRVATGLSRKGHDVEVFVLSDRDKRFTDNGVVVNCVKNRFFDNCIGNRFIETKRVLVGSYNLKKAVLKVHKENKFDLIQTSNCLAPGFLLAKSKKVPVVTRLSTFAPYWRSTRGRGGYLDATIAEKLEVILMRASIGVYAPSEIIKDHVRLNEPLDVAHILPPFVADNVNENNKVFKDYSGNRNYLLYFGALTPLKGIDFILNNLRSILKENNDVDFVFIGKFGDKDKISDAAGEFANRVHHFSTLTKEELLPFIRNARAIILPSWIDNLPNTCLESMFLGKVVLTTLTSGFKDIIENENNGFLINYDNDQELCKAINTICNLDEKDLNKIGKSAKQTIEIKFNEDKNLDTLVNYYHQVLLKVSRK